MNSFYDEQELKEIGFKALGENVLISRKSSIYGAENISIGNNVRIDDFCILSGKIDIRNYVHLAAYCALYGGKDGIFMDDFSGFSTRVSVYSVSDDYSGESLTNPTIPDKYKKVDSKKIYIGKHAIIGSTSVVLPGARIAEGSAFGSFSLIDHASEPWSVNVGIPFKQIKERSKKLLLLEREFLGGELCEEI